MRPRGDDWLEDDLKKIRCEGIQTIVSMLEGWEATSLGLASEEALCHQLGLQFVSYPIPDRSSPSDRGGFDGFVSDLADRLRAGENVGVHCRGCIGRSTIAAACTLTKLGWTARSALTAVETVRGCIVPDTEEQAEFILDFGLNNGRA